MSPRITILLGCDGYAVERAAHLRIHRPRTSAHVLWPEYDGHPLHPSRHGDLADEAIADSVRMPVVITTHSDVFVLRVRRRVAEGALVPAAVLLVWVEPDGSERPIPLNDRGTPEWWPKGVFAEAQAEFAEIRRVLNLRDREPGEGERFDEANDTPERRALARILYETPLGARVVLHGVEVTRLNSIAWTVGDTSGGIEWICGMVERASIGGTSP